MSNDNFFHIAALLNAELQKAHEAGLSVAMRTNGWPIQLKENELLKVNVTINDCQHEWIELEFLGKRIKGETDFPSFASEPQTYTVCNLCGMTK